jgi:hypothetical protein
MYAQTAVPDSIFKQVDTALANQSTPELNTLFSKNSGAAWYPKLEAYVLKKARQLIIENKLDLARDISLLLIDNNLDNQDAVDLYQTVQAAITKRDAESKKVAEQQTLQVYKQQASEAKIKQDLSKTYKTVTNTSTGKKVYLDQDFNSHYRTYSWDLMLGLANGGYLYDHGESSAKYGLSLSGSFFFHGEKFSIGADTEGTGMIIAFMGTQSIDWTGSGVMSISSNALSKYLALRAGYTAFGYDYGNEAADPALFHTPVLGAGFRDVKMGDSGRLQTGIDWYPGHLYTAGMLAAAGTHLEMNFVLAKMQDFDIHFLFGLKEKLLLYGDGLRSDSKLTLAIGVGNYD